MVESFSTYYGEVPLQKIRLIRHFRFYLISDFVTKFILHRRGFAIFVNNSEIYPLFDSEVRDQIKVT